MIRKTYILLLSLGTVLSYAQDQDSTVLQKPNEENKRFWHSHTFSLSTQSVSIDVNEGSLYHHRFNWNSRINEKVFIDIGIANVDLIEYRTNVYSIGLRTQGEGYGYGSRFKLFADDLQGFKTMDLSGFKYLNRTLISTADLSFISTQGTLLAPLRFGITKVLNKVGVSVSINQDLLKLTSSKPLYKASLTYETIKSNVFSAYFVTGDVNQPLENPLLNSLNMTQLGYGAWAKINMNKSLSISIALGQLRLQTENNITKSEEINFSLILKL